MNINQTSPDNNWQPAGAPRKKNNLAVLALTIIAAIAIGAVGLTYVSFSSTISNLNSQLTSANSQIKTDNATISADKSHISSENLTISNDKSEISSQNLTISNDKSIIIADNATISSLDKILSNGMSVSVVNVETVTESSADYIPAIAVHNCSHSGYLLIAGQTTAANGTLLVTQTVDGYQYAAQYLSGPANTAQGYLGYFWTGLFNLAIPVSAGVVGLYFASFDNTTGSDSATFTVTYVY